MFDCICIAEDLLKKAFFRMGNNNMVFLFEEKFKIKKLSIIS